MDEKLRGCHRVLLRYRDSSGAAWDLDRRGVIFVNDVDRQDLLKTLAEACQKTACDYVHLNPVRAHLPGTEERLLA